MIRAVILAGGLGTRLSEETDLRPKPLIEIGNYPILWHVMKIYEASGITDFVICAGYKASMIKRYFANYHLEVSDVEISIARGRIRYLNSNAFENWNVTVIDTGIETMTGGRIKRVAPLIGQQAFCMTYGDGVANLDVRALIAAGARGETAIRQAQGGGGADAARPGPGHQQEGTGPRPDRAGGQILHRSSRHS